MVTKKRARAVKPTAPPAAQVDLAAEVEALRQRIEQLEQGPKQRRPERPPPEQGSMSPMERIAAAAERVAMAAEQANEVEPSPGG